MENQFKFNVETPKYNFSNLDNAMREWPKIKQNYEETSIWNKIKKFMKFGV